MGEFIKRVRSRLGLRTNHGQYAYLGSVKKADPPSRLRRMGVEESSYPCKRRVIESKRRKMLQEKISGRMPIELTCSVGQFE